MEKEVVEMRNSFKEKEKTLTEERDKAIKAAEYVKHFLFDHSYYRRLVMIMKGSKHQSGKQRLCSLCWKLPDRAQSFLYFCWQIVTE